jgi:glycosyltransferase involved in cell wall biosynthesis
VFIHPSDELYGADRMLLEFQAALPPEIRDRAQFWLPTDLPHGAAPLCEELERRGGNVRHVDLPILRRADRTPTGLARLARRALRLRRELRRIRPELVYCTTSAAFLAAPVARSARVPRVVGHVQELWSRSDQPVLGPLARSTHQLLAISEPVRHQLPEKLRSRTTVVLNGTPEPESLVDAQERSGPLAFLVASRWNGWKGHRTLLAAWDMLEEPGTLVVLGGPPASGESTDVPALVRQLRRPETVQVAGETDDPHAYFEAADVVVVPSDDPEPFGLVAVEAFARGRAVVGSDAGGLSDIITDGVDGWLYPARDAEALARVLASLTRERVAAAGATARRTYLDRFTTARYARDWLRALNFG